jgi:hypothetical protein
MLAAGRGGNQEKPVRPGTVIVPLLRLLDGRARGDPVAGQVVVRVVKPSPALRVCGLLR